MNKKLRKKIFLFFLLYFAIFSIGFCIYKVLGHALVETLNNFSLVDNRVNPPNFVADFVAENYIKILITFSWFGSLIIFVIYHCWKRVLFIFSNFSKRKIWKFFSFLSTNSIGALLLLWSGFYNKFPLVYHDDTGNYIRDLFSRSRPVGYGFFVQILCPIIYPSLWTVIVFQALLTSCLITRVSYVFLTETKKKAFISLGILALVVFSTDVSKYVSWIMADISTSWLFFGMVLFMISHKWYDRYLSAALIVMSIFNHTSHAALSIMSGFILLSSTFAFRDKFPVQFKKCQTLFVVIFLSIVSIMFLHFGIGCGFRLSASGGSNFLLAKIGSSTKAVSRVLDTYCHEKTWHLCNYKDIFDNPQMDSDYLLWNSNSPLSKVAMFQDQSQQNEIILYAVKNYWPEIFIMFCRDSLRQFSSFDSSDGLGPAKHEYKKCEIYKSIKIKLPRDLKPFLQGRQQQSLGVKVRVLSLDEKIVSYVTIIFMVFFSMLYFFKQRYKLALLLLSAFIFICLNAMICGSFSTVHGRYQGRVVWIASYCIFLSFFSVIQKKRKIKN